MTVDPQQSVLLRLERKGRRAPRVQLRGESDTGSTGSCGHYDVLGALASGGVGELLRGRDIDLGRDVALKVLRDKHASDTELVQRMVDEAQIAGQLQHPGIVPVYELGLREDRRPFIAMKLVKGKTLAALLKSRDTRRRSLIQVFEQLCRTVAYAHERGVVHRDLKPSNVMVGGFGEVQVLDWGSARILPRGGVADERREPDDITRIATVRSSSETGRSAGSVLGTPAYMPPEQALGQLDDLDERSDVFSLGAILCEVLTGTPPYLEADGDLFAQAARAELDGATARLAGCEADRALVELARTCLAPIRADRPAHAGEVADAVVAHMAAVEERAHRGTVASVRAEEAAERLRLETREQRKARKQTILLSSITAAVLVLGATLFTLVDGARRDRIARAAGAAADALAEAERLRGAEDWSGARTAVEKATALARDASEGIRARATALKSAIESEATETAERQRRRAAERTFISQLDAVRMLTFGTVTKEEKHARFRAVFETHGVDVDDPNAAVETMEAVWSRVRVELGAAFDEWFFFQPEDEGRRRLSRLANAIDPDPWRMRFRDAREATDGDALTALANELLQTTDVSVQTYVALARALLAAKIRGLPIEVLRAAWREYPGDFWVNYILALRLQAEKRHAESVPFAEAAVALRPELTSSWLALQAAHRGSGEADRQEATLRAAWRALPGASNIVNNLMMMLYRQERRDEAAAVMARALELNPTSGQPYVTWGIELERDPKKHDEALAAFRKALEIEPDNDLAHMRVGHNLKNRGDLQGAIAAYRAAAEATPHNAIAAYWFLAETLITARDADGALQAAEAGARQWPSFWLFSKERGRALILKGDYAGAIKALETAIELASAVDVEMDASMASLYALLGFSHFQSQQWEATIPAYRKALELGTDRPQHAHYALGVSLDNLGRLKEAVAPLREAVRADPAFGDAQFQLGAVCFKTGRFAEAHEAFRNAASAPRTRSGWRKLAPGLVKRTEGLLRLEGLLPEVIAGTFMPKSAKEQVELAQLCALKKVHLPTAVRLYEGAFESDPSLAEYGVLYNAACAAALVNTTGTRPKALRWLRAALDLLRASPTRFLNSQHQHWTRDKDLATVRDKIDALPEDEREAWKKLWADVDALLERAVAK